MQGSHKEAIECCRDEFKWQLHHGRNGPRHPTGWCFSIYEGSHEHGKQVGRRPRKDTVKPLTTPHATTNQHWQCESCHRNLPFMSWFLQTPVTLLPVIPLMDLFSYLRMRRNPDSTAFLVGMVCVVEASGSAVIVQWQSLWPVLNCCVSNVGD